MDDKDAWGNVYPDDYMAVPLADVYRILGGLVLSADTRAHIADRLNEKARPMIGYLGSRKAAPMVVDESEFVWMTEEEFDPSAARGAADQG